MKGKEDHHHRNWPTPWVNGPRCKYYTKNVIVCFLFFFSRLRKIHVIVSISNILLIQKLPFQKMWMFIQEKYFPLKLILILAILLARKCDWLHCMRKDDISKDQFLYLVGRMISNLAISQIKRRSPIKTVEKIGWEHDWMRPLGRRLYEEAVAAYNFNGDREGPLSRRCRYCILVWWKGEDQTDADVVCLLTAPFFWWREASFLFILPSETNDMA